MGRRVFLLPIVSYGLGFLALIIGIIFAQRLFASPKRKSKFPAIWLCAFGGLIGGASIGNFFSIVLYNLPKGAWTGLIFVQPIERAIFAAGAMLIGVPLLTGLNKIGIIAGPKGDNNED